jgi:hypothetical protein
MSEQIVKKQINHTIGDKDDIRRVVNLTFDNVPYVSTRVLWMSGLIYWVKAYRTVLTYVSNDYRSIFSPIMTGSRSGKRYLISTDSIVEFIYRFETNQLTSSDV